MSYRRAKPQLRKTLLALLLTSIGRAQPDPFLQALPELRRLLYQDRPAFVRALKPWEEKLPDWTPGPARSEFFELRANFCSSQRNPEGEIANLLAAIGEPGLDPHRKFHCRLELARAYLYQKNHSAYQQTLFEAVKESPARLYESELSALLRLQNEEAKERGDLTFNFTYYQMNAQKARPGYIYPLLELAEWYRAQGQTQAQLEWWSAARDSLQNDPKSAADPREWGALWRAAPASQKAWALEQQLLCLQSQSPLQQARARVDIAVGMQGQESPAADIEAVLQPALIQLQETPDPDYRTYQSLSTLYRKQPEKAALYLRRALEMAEHSPGEKVGLGHLYFSLAATLEVASQPEEGLSIFRQGLLYVIEKEPDQVPRFFVRCVLAASRLNREDIVQELRSQILEALPRLSPDKQGLALEALLESYLQESQECTQVLVRMRTFYQQRMVESLQEQNWEAYAQAGRGLSTTLGRLGDHRSSREVLQQVLNHTISQRMREIVEEQLLDLLVYSQETRTAEALAQRLMDEPDSRRRRVGLEKLVTLRMRQGQWQAALDRIGTDPQTSNMLYSRFQCLQKLRRWSECWQALEAWERAFPPDASRRTQSLMTRADLCKEMGQPQQALRWKAQALDHLLQHPDPFEAVLYLSRVSDWRPPYQQILNVMNPAQSRQLTALWGKALAQSNRQAQAQELLHLSSPPQEPLGAVLDRLRLAHPELESSIGLHSANLSLLQKHLRKDQWLVAYLPVEEQILLVVLTRDSQTYQKLPVSLIFLEKQVDQDWLACSRHQKADLDGWKQRLLEPVNQLGHPRSLLIAPCGPLWKLPFTALAAPDQSVSLLSTTDFTRLAEGQAAPFRGGRALAIGAPPAAELPGAEAELRKLASIWPGCQLKLGPQATPAVLLEQKQPLALLHIATHTLARPEDPLQSGVQLHGSNLLLTQLHQLNMQKGSLVVLSSCRGALPLNPGQMQPISLSSALSAAGAQTVIANLWDADDQAAALFFDHFYRRLAQHRQVAKAFQEAQQALRRADPDPYYWAGFCLLGNPPL
ncbi:MAG: CHAT domain-containing protein [Vulcanimicrobiota bacterium]